MSINHNCNNYISGIKTSYIDFIGDELRNGVRLKIRTRNYWLVYKDKYIISIAFAVHSPNNISSNSLELKFSRYLSIFTQMVNRFQIIGF